MADILLTHCNHLYFDRKQVRKMQPYPPLQTLLAAAVLRRASRDVRVFDSTFESPEEGFRHALEQERPKLLVICEDHFNFLTKMCLVRNRELAFRMSNIAHEAGVPVVVASSDASDHLVPYLKNGADYVVLGEVEETLSDLSAALLDRKGRIEDMVGIAWRDRSGALRIVGRRSPIESLDALPLPGWDLIDMEPYRAAWTAAHGKFSLNAVSSRGCPYKCNWCAKPVFGSNYHVRSADSVAEEVRILKTTYRPEHLWFADDIFALSAGWTHAFSDAVVERDAEIPFKMQSRCDLMTRNTVAALRRAGCAEVWMGAESGSQRILDAMDKGIQVRHIYEARENLGRHNIRVGLFLQFGYPGETWEDIQMTIDMVRATAPDEIGVSVAYPLPGTRFYDAVALQLGKKQNWDDSEDLAMMFQGAYSTNFYHRLRDALHAEVDGAPPAEVAALWAGVQPAPVTLCSSC